MQTASLSISTTANRSTAQSSGITRTNVRTKVSAAASIAKGKAIRTSVRFTEAVMQFAHAALKVKVPQSVAEMAQCCKRTAEHWDAGTRAIGMEEFFHLLEGDYGVEFFRVFWDCVPEVTRERWIQTEILKRKLDAREAARKAEDEEIAQLQMTLNSNKI